MKKFRTLKEGKRTIKIQVSKYTLFLKTFQKVGARSFYFYKYIVVTCLWRKKPYPTNFADYVNQF